MTEIQKTINNLKNKRHLGRFYIAINKVEKYVDGFVLDTSKQFVLVREFIDFTSKGLLIIPLSKINEIRQAKMEKSFTRILN